MPLPKERERVVSAQHTQVSFVMSSELKAELDQVRALLGSKGATLNLAELIAEMARLSRESLAARKFGKKRVQAGGPTDNPGDSWASPGLSVSEVPPKTVPLSPNPVRVAEGGDSQKSPPFCLPSRVSTPAPECKASQAVRYIPKSTKHTVWMRDRGTCVKCGSLRNLQYDHIHPVALGGDSTAENVRLLCFSCNQRRAIQTFGIRAQV
jgi:hypothetical protein